MSYAEYPVKQLKTILRTKFNELKPRPKTGAISKLKKKEVLLLNNLKLIIFQLLKKIQL